MRPALKGQFRRPVHEEKKCPHDWASELAALLGQEEGDQKAIDGLKSHFILTDTRLHPKQTSMLRQKFPSTPGKSRGVSTCSQHATCATHLPSLKHTLSRQRHVDGLLSCSIITPSWTPYRE